MTSCEELADRWGLRDPPESADRCRKENRRNGAPTTGEALREPPGAVCETRPGTPCESAPPLPCDRKTGRLSALRCGGSPYGTGPRFPADHEDPTDQRAPRGRSYCRRAGPSPPGG